MVICGDIRGGIEGAFGGDCQEMIGELLNVLGMFFLGDKPGFGVNVVDSNIFIMVGKKMNSVGFGDGNVNMGVMGILDMQAVDAFLIVVKAHNTFELAQTILDVHDIIIGHKGK